MTAQPLNLPTRKDEAWRYSDHAAVARHWPAAPARVIAVAAGDSHEDVLHVTDGGITDIEVQVAAGATARLAVLLNATDYARVSVVAHLGRGAHFEFGGIVLGAGEANQEIVTDIRHNEPEATSQQRVRVVIDEQAVGTYLGRIAVARDAQKTDAEQSARALVLRRTATANLKPELEIFADDVKCAHGCTVGELDKNAIFYLESRGIPTIEAKALLTQAFVADALEGLEGVEAREALQQLAFEWLGKRA